MAGAEYVPIANLKGPAGPGGPEGKPGGRGDPGPQGLPGTNGVESDTAVGTYLATEGTAARGQLTAYAARKSEVQALIQGVAAGFASAPMIGYGHSFIDGGYTGGPASSGLWANQLAAKLGVTYTKRGVGGSLAEPSGFNMWGTTALGFTVGSKATIVIQNMLNSLRLNGEDAPTWRGVRYTLRTMCALAAAKTLIPANNARFTFSASGWGAVTSSTDYPGGVFRATVAGAGIGATVDFTTATDPNGTQLLTLARRVGLTPSLTEIRRMDTNEVLLLWDNQNNAAAGIATGTPKAVNYAPTAFSLNVPRGTAIRVTNLASTDGTSTTTICGLLERDPDSPNTVLLMKEPKLADYSASTSFPNGSDAAVDYFNGIMDEIAAEQSNVIAASPEPYWTKANAATLVLADKVHPNTLGNEALRDAALSGIYVQSGKVALRTKTVVADTGWTVLDSYLAAGMTGNLRGRRIGDQITIAGNISAGTFASATAAAVATALPASWRPALTANGIGAASFGTTLAPGIARISTAGDISALQASGTARTTCQFTLSFIA